MVARAAAAADVPGIAELLLAEARRRMALDPGLWAMKAGAGAAVDRALRVALDEAGGPVRQVCVVVDEGGQMAAVGRGLRLPVPPIYAGRFGAPGLILADHVQSDVASGAAGVAAREGVEVALLADGAQVLVQAVVPRREALAPGYGPLTLYYTRDLGRSVEQGEAIRPAEAGDLPGIVAGSAVNRRVLHGIDRFWEPHPEADVRFGAWMGRSLGLDDRDMLVADGPRGLAGYAVAQPAGPLHLPPAHEAAGVGFLDDFHHEDFADPDGLAGEGAGAAALLAACERAFVARGCRSVLVVCPAGWASKRAVLERAGYRVGLNWGIRWA